MEYDVIIIGAGPGGLSAALYASRAGLKTLVLEGSGVGGQMNYTTDVENYIGFIGTGPELSEKMRAQTAKFGAEFSGEKVKEIKSAELPIKTVKTRKNDYRTKTIIIATGANPKKLAIPGEEELRGAGVSYCATCDGAFFKGKTAMVAGGGNTAFTDALYLANFCERVTIVHRRDKFRASAALVGRAKANPKIMILTNSTIEKIQGDNVVKSVVIRNTISGKMAVADTDCVFVAVGRTPETSLFGALLELDEAGYIVTDANMRTSISGIYAIGDVRNTPLRQIVTACADGAVAATDIAEHLN